MEREPEKWLPHLRKVAGTQIMSGPLFIILIP